MAIVINANPGSYYSAQGDLIFVVYEATKANDPVTYPDYKYVADVYIGSTLAVRLKKVPQPDNKRGVFNIGDVVRSYFATTFDPDATALLAQELGLADFFIDVTVKFGEEYDFTLYTNLTVDSQRRYYNHYNGRLLGTNTNLPPYVDKVVSLRPYAVAVMGEDNFTFLPYFPLTSNPYNVVITKYGAAAPGVPVLIEWGYFTSDPYSTVDSETMQFGLSYISGANSHSLNYTSAGNLKYLVLKEPATEPVKTNWFNTSFNYGTFPDAVFREPVVIGAYRYYVSREPVVLDSTSFAITYSNLSAGSSTPAVASNTFTVVLTPAEALKLQVLNVSPGMINILTPGFIDDAVLYYTVQVGAASLYRFDMVCEARFQVYRLHFLNKFGGFETRNFTKVSRDAIDIVKTSFGKLPYTIDSDGHVNYFNSNNNVYNETKSVYASQYTEKLTLNTDILTDDEYIWLGDLALSPMVYIEQDGFFRPVSITNTNYEFKKHVNDKLTNLIIDLEFGEMYNAQYR
jgi:hypothetical protein